MGKLELVCSFGTRVDIDKVVDLGSVLSRQSPRERSFFRYLVEAVHVELSHKGRKVVVLKVLRQDLAGKLVRVDDDEAARGRPMDVLLVLFIFNHASRMAHA